MKLLQLFIVVVLTTTTITKLFAQDEITLAYNSVHIGRNVSLAYYRNIKQHAIIAGIKYQINSLIQDNQNEIFKKRFYATDFYEHWGFVVGYRYTLKRINFVKPFIFYEMQLTNSHTRNEFVFPVGVDQNGIVYYTKDIVYQGPTFALDNYVGFGLNIPIFGFLSITQKIGFGGVFYFKTDPSYVLVNNRSQEFGYILSLGFSYNFLNNQ